MIRINGINVKAKYIVLLLLIILIIGALFLTPLGKFVLNDLLTENGLREFVGQFGIFAPAAFGIIEYIAVILLVPATIFAVFAGLFFGKLTGLIIVVIALTLSGSTAFLIGRYFGKDLTGKLASHKKIGLWVNKIEKKVGNDGFTSFFIMRCLFLPYIATSYASGLVRSAKLLDFTLATLLANTIFSFMFVYLGDNLLKGPKALIVPIILILIVIQVPFWTRKLKLGKGW